MRDDSKISVAGVGNRRPQRRGTVAAALLLTPLTLAHTASAAVVADGAPTLNGDALTVMGGLITLAVIAKVVTGLLVDAKKLREHPATLPSPVVVREADQFVTKHELKRVEENTRQQMTELRAYVHEAVHEVRQLAQTITKNLNEQADSMQESFARLDGKNEQRVEKLARRVDDVINAMPEKIIGLLKTTGAIGGRS